MTKSNPAAKSNLVIYPAPKEEALSTDYLIEVNGKPVPVYVIKSQWHDKKYSAAYFDFAGAVTVKVSIPSLRSLYQSPSPKFRPYVPKTRHPQ